MPKPFRTEQTGDRQTNQLQENVRLATKTLRSGPFGDGNLVKGIPFLLGDFVTVNHGLGRPHQGWIATRVVASISSTPLFWEVEDLSTDTTVTFGSVDLATVDIWFF